VNQVDLVAAAVMLFSLLIYKKLHASARFPAPLFGVVDLRLSQFCPPGMGFCIDTGDTGTDTSTDTQ
jgi:hypothetical protein